MRRRIKERWRVARPVDGSSHSFRRAALSARVPRNKRFARQVPRAVGSKGAQECSPNRRWSSPRGVQDDVFINPRETQIGKVLGALIELPKVSDERRVGPYLVAEPKSRCPEPALELCLPGRGKVPIRSQSGKRKKHS